LGIKNTSELGKEFTLCITNMITSMAGNDILLSLGKVG
jgi:hypothetical protein